MGANKTIIAFIAGAAAGSIAGILLAPDSGAATRKKIIEKSNGLKDAVTDSVNEFLDECRRLASTQSVKEEIPEAHTGTDMIRQVVHHAKEKEA